MKLYRLCSEREVSDIFDSVDFKDIGRFWMNTKFFNNHTYLERERYMHFFLRMRDIFYLQPTLGSYLCTYDIDDELAKKFLGTGVYYSLEKNEELENVLECAIPSRYLSFENLDEVIYIDAFINCEDLETGMYYQKFTSIYEKEEKIKKIG